MFCCGGLVRGNDRKTVVSPCVTGLYGPRLYDNSTKHANICASGSSVTRRIVFEATALLKEKIMAKGNNPRKKETKKPKAEKPKPTAVPRLNIDKNK